MPYKKYGGRGGGMRFKKRSYKSTKISRAPSSRADGMYKEKIKFTLNVEVRSCADLVAG